MKKKIKHRVCKVKFCWNKTIKGRPTCSEAHRIQYRREYRKLWQRKYKDKRKRNRATPEYRAWQRENYKRKKIIALDKH